MHLDKVDWHAFDAASYLAGVHFATGYGSGTARCPPALRLFGSGVLCGDIKRPRQNGRPRGDNVQLRCLQFALCHFVAEKALLPLSRSRDPYSPESFSACDAVADAFSRNGRPTTQAHMASLCYDKGHAKIRALADALTMLDFGNTK